MRGGKGGCRPSPGDENGPDRKGPDGPAGALPSGRFSPLRTMALLTPGLGGPQGGLPLKPKTPPPSPLVQVRQSGGLQTIPVTSSQPHNRRYASLFPPPFIKHPRPLSEMSQKRPVGGQRRVWARKLTSDEEEEGRRNGMGEGSLRERQRREAVHWTWGGLAPLLLLLEEVPLLKSG